MKLLLAVAFICVVVFHAQATGDASQDPSCGLSVTTPPPSAATTVGPEEVTSRLHLVSQPDSPVQIVATDFTGMQLLISGNSYTFQQNAVLEVSNRSNQVIERIDVRVMVGPCLRGAPGGGPFWMGRLLPGETTRIRVSGGAGSGSGTGTVRVWAWVDRVDVNACVYKPAQIIPRSLCDAGGLR